MPGVHSHFWGLPLSTNPAALRTTIADALFNRVGTVALPRQFADLAKDLAPHRVFDENSEGRDDVDVVVRSDHVDEIDLDEVIAVALAGVKSGGAVVARLRTATAEEVGREALLRRLTERSPQLAFRITDLSPDPWVSVTRRLPVAWLLLGRPRLGKTSSALEIGRRSAGLRLHAPRTWAWRMDG